MSLRRSIIACMMSVLAPAAAFAGETGSVIFIHPDGASSASWAAARALYVGPDSDLHWDRLPHIALYRGHMADSLTATSNGGATTHAYGVKVESDAYGRSAGGERGRDIVDADGHSISVAHQALRAGLPVGLVQTGVNTEPGTGCFVARTESRGNHDEIAAQLIESGVQVILGGGECFFIPEGVKGMHGPGKRKDGRNLVDEARIAGYEVVFTRDDLLSLPDDVTKVLGLFASGHTFNAMPEETLAEKNLPMYWPDAPTVGEMTRIALRVLTRQGERFLLVVEEEGTDNFGNNNNASGMLEAMRRADQAFAVARWYLQFHPDTLIVTAADSDAGGMRLAGISVQSSADIPSTLPALSDNGSPIDGIGGTGTPPFIAAPDRTGKSLPFAIHWASKRDLSGGVLVRGEGLNAHLIRGSMDNTGIAQLMRLTLFGGQTPGDAASNADPTLTTAP